MIVRELVAEDFDRGFLETLSNLASVKGLDAGSAKEIFFKILQNNVYRFYVMEDIIVHNMNDDSKKDSQIVGCITLLIEQKFIHDGGLVGHIEDVTTRKGFEGKGIGKALVNHALLEAKRLGCYKVLLNCKDTLTPFYNKSGFYTHQICMRVDF